MLLENDFLVTYDKSRQIDFREKFDKPERIIHNSAIAHEVTKRKILNNSTEEEQKRLYAILNGLPGLVYLRTSEGKVIFANHNFKKIHGDPDNRKCYNILLNKDEPCSNCHTQATSGTEILKQWQCVIKDTIFEVFQHPFQDSEGMQLFLMQMLDITKRKLAEEEMARLDRLNLVGELAASIAHEVRNPMTTVRGFLQILKNRDTSHENIGYYDLMISELDRANGIITEFLSIAKTKTESNTVVKLNNLVDSLYPLILADATNQDKKVILETKKVTELTMNEREIRQLILNLTRNGFEAMPSRGILKIMTYMEANSIVLAVQDQGIGIREDILAKLGTPFLTTKEGGTGLGLATCYNIAERHNAKIDVESSSSGTTFFVKFQLS
ncbi:MAG: ATP-binding protein [Desulfosporosinus sp.]|nr:ATP-binding protein [Desulfosporosinus sp.]